jgi:hypothetical protein
MKHKNHPAVETAYKRPNMEMLFYETQHSLSSNNSILCTQARLCETQNNNNNNKKQK